MTRVGATSSKTKLTRGITATDTTASGMAKETRGSLTVDTNRACSNGRSGEDKYSNDVPQSKGSVCIIQLIYHRCK